MLAGDVLVSHIGGETGQTDRLETLTVSVRQSSDVTPALIDVPLSVAALDNSPPQLVIGSHLIAEIDTPVSLGPDVVYAQDRDTSPQRLRFFVTQTPVWGRLEKRPATMIRRGLDVLLLTFGNCFVNAQEFRLTENVLNANKLLAAVDNTCFIVSA